MAKDVCLSRLRKELMQLKKNPILCIEAEPDPANILEWHYCLTPTDSVYEGGFYHGLVRFPPSYPFNPPSILMYTPSGRFETHMKLCLSMSDYHKETWNTQWSVGTILNGLLSFMLTDDDTTGAIKGVSDEKKREYAAKSLEFNRTNKKFCELFPHYVHGTTRPDRDLLHAKPASEIAPVPDNLPPPATATTPSKNTSTNDDDNNDDDDDDDDDGVGVGVGVGGGGRGGEGEEGGVKSGGGGISKSLKNKKKKKKKQQQQRKEQERAAAAQEGDNV